MIQKKPLSSWLVNLPPLTYHPPPQLEEFPSKLEQGVDLKSITTSTWTVLGNHISFRTFGFIFPLNLWISPPRHGHFLTFSDPLGAELWTS